VPERAEAPEAFGKASSYNKYCQSNKEFRQGETQLTLHGLKKACIKTAGKPWGFTRSFWLKVK
jgi:hypothetical protein